MKNNGLKRSLALALAFTMLGSNFAYAKETKNMRREYIFSSYESGKLSKENTVSIWQSSDSETDFTEKTNLSDVKNLKGTYPVKKEGGELSWKLPSRDLYYQGKSDSPLPLDVKMTSKLDGKEVDYGKLKDVTGHLEIKIKLDNKMYKRVVIQGEERRIYLPYLADLVFVGEDKSITNIKHNVGEVSKDGSRLVLNAMLCPGLKESVKKDLDGLVIDEVAKIDDYLNDELVLEMDVENFNPQAIMLGFARLNLNDEKIKNIDDLDSLKDAIKELNDKGQEIEDGSKKLSEGQYKFSSAIGDLGKGTRDLATGAHKLSDGMSQVNVNMLKSLNASAKLKEGAKGLSTGANKLETGSSQFKNGLNKYASSVEEYSKGVNDISSKIGDLDLGKINSSTRALRDGSANLRKGISEATEQFALLNQNTSKYNLAIDQFKDATSELEAKGNELNKASKSLQEAGNKIDKTTERLLDPTNKLVDGAKNLSRSTGDFSKVLSSQDLSENVSGNLEANMQVIGEKLSKLTNSEEVKNNPELAGLVKDMADTFDLEKEAAKKIGDSSKKISSTASSLKEAASGIDRGAKSLEKSLRDYSSSIAALNKATGSYVDSFEKYQESADKYFTSVGQVSKRADKLVSSSEKIYIGQTALLSAYQEIEKGADKLYQGNKEFNTRSEKAVAEINNYLPKLSSLTDITNRLNLGASSLNDNYGKINGGLENLNEAASKLSSGLDSYNKGADQLFNKGTKELAKGASDLSKGVNTLDGNMPKLSDANGKLKDASKTLSDGIGKYMEEGVNKLYDRSQEGFDKVDKLIEIKDELVKFSQEIDKSFTGYTGPVEVKLRYVIKLS